MRRARAGASPVIHVATLTGAGVDLAERDVRELAKSLSGPVLRPGDAGYDDE